MTGLNIQRMASPFPWDDLASVARLLSSWFQMGPPGILPWRRKQGPIPMDGWFLGTFHHSMNIPSSW